MKYLNGATNLFQTKSHLCSNSTIRFFLIIFAAFFVFCGCKTTETIYKTEIEYIVVKPSNALLEECPQIQNKEIKTNGDLASAYTNLMFDYFICSNRIKTLKLFFIEYDKDHQLPTDWNHVDLQMSSDIGFRNCTL